MTLDAQQLLLIKSSGINHCLNVLTVKLKEEKENRVVLPHVRILSLCVIQKENAKFSARPQSGIRSVGISCQLGVN